MILFNKKINRKALRTLNRRHNGSQAWLNQHI
jgi:hypothetical protein